MTQASLNYETKSKREMLRDAMLAGRRMSKQDILHEFGIWNSGDQIMKLRRSGLSIKTEMVTRGENTFAEYFLEPENTSAASF